MAEQEESEAVAPKTAEPEVALRLDGSASPTLKHHTAVAVEEEPSTHLLTVLIPARE